MPLRCLIPEIYTALISRVESPEPADVWAGIVLIVLVLEGTRRAVGWWLPGITGAFLAYAFVGPWMPELFSHRGYSVRRVVGQLYLTTEGLFGIPLGVSSTFVFAFVLFGALLERTGAAGQQAAEYPGQRVARSGDSEAGTSAPIFPGVAGRGHDMAFRPLDQDQRVVAARRLMAAG